MGQNLHYLALRGWFLSHFSGISHKKTSPFSNKAKCTLPEPSQYTISGPDLVRASWKFLQKRTFLIKTTKNGQKRPKITHTPPRKIIGSGRKKVSSFLPILLYYSSCTVCLFCFVKIKFWNFLLIKFFKLIKMLVYNKTIFQTMTALNLNCMKENFLDHKSYNNYTVIQYI